MSASYIESHSWEYVPVLLFVRIGRNKTEKAFSLQGCAKVLWNSNALQFDYDFDTSVANKAGGNHLGFNQESIY